MKKLPTLCLTLLLFVITSLSLVGCKAVTTTTTTTVTTTSTTVTTTITPVSRVITDMYGREVTIPTTINIVLCAGPIEMQMVYLLAPDKLGGLVFNFNGNPPLVQEKYVNLPMIGGWYGNTQGNYETFIAAAPDIILEGTEANLPDRQEKFSPIPVVGVKLTDYVTGYEEEIRFLGDLLGEQEQAESLIAYYKETMTYVDSIVSKIPDSEKVTVYYAEGKDGLSTDPTGSMHTRLLEVCGGINVADVPLQQGMGQAAASMEQILLWDPDMIIIGRSTQATLYDAVMSDATWGQLRAVKNNNVCVRPQNPYSWFDGPPGVCQIVGMYWMVHTLYPEQTAGLDLNAKVKEFYSKFLHYELTDEQVAQLIANRI